MDSVCLTHCVEDGVPLYAAPHSEEVLAELPKFHHEALGEEPQVHGRRVRLECQPNHSSKDVWSIGYSNAKLDGPKAIAKRGTVSTA